MEINVHSFADNEADDNCFQLSIMRLTEEERNQLTERWITCLQRRSGILIAGATKVHGARPNHKV